MFIFKFNIKLNYSSIIQSTFTCFVPAKTLYTLSRSQGDDNSGINKAVPSVAYLKLPDAMTEDNQPDAEVYGNAIGYSNFKMEKDNQPDAEV